MKEIRDRFFAMNINRFRFYVQIVSFAVLLYGGYLTIDFGTHLPTFACPFAPRSSGTCYLFAFQHQLSMPFKQMAGPRGLALLVGLAGFVGLFVFLNKAWCGFVCPLGTIQDWITKLRIRMGLRYSVYSVATFKKLKKIKYLLLLLLILLPLAMGNAILGLPRLSHDFATPYCMVCPARPLLPLLSADASQLTIDFSSRTKLVLTTLGMVVTGLFLAGSFAKRRFFCLFCPMSALQYLFSKIGLLRMTKDGSRCTRCGNCYRVCDMGLVEIAENLERRNIVTDDCMMCFKCVAACPEEACLKVSFLGKTVYMATEEGFYEREAKRYYRATNHRG